MNAADAEAGKRAMDSLINYETVKLYGNEALEQQRNDACLAGAHFCYAIGRQFQMVKNGWNTCRGRFYMGCCLPVRGCTCR